MTPSRITPTRRGVPECLVTTPMGVRPFEAGGGRLDFNRLYEAGIRPGVQAAGLTALRLDELDHGASIQRRVVRALADATCVVADITTLNANVLYEVGVRHALRKNVTILIRESRQVIPFDLHGLPLLTYGCEGEFLSDVEADHLKRSLADLLARRLRADGIDSPLHDAHLLDFSSVFQQFQVLPPQHERHRRKLEEFRESADYGRSVFVMTKYPALDMTTPRDAEMQRVIGTVINAVRARGYRARLASEREYYDNLWDNVELYLLGCSRGIAIVEDKYASEMNPNVAMEWGWMRGAGKRVLFLVEENFQNLRADWQGLLRKPFAWSDPGRSIPGHVKRWLAAER